MNFASLRRCLPLALLLLPWSELSAQGPRTLASDGAWTWYNDARAVFKDGLLYYGYVRNSDGRAALSVVNPATASAPTLLLTSSWSEKDDHNNPALLPLEDGRILCFYARHLTSVTTFHSRLSTGTNPVTAADWGNERVYTSAERISYVNPFQLSAESGRVYNFIRNLNYNPTFLTSDDFGATWSPAKILIQSGTLGTVRPYVKYASNGTNRIDFFYSDGHPRDLNNSLYHAYYKDGSLYKTDGTFLKTLDAAPLLHDSGERGSLVYQYNASASNDPHSHIPTGRAWCWETSYDSTGNPVAVFTVQRDNVMGSGWRDDRIYYYYAKWIPGTGWRKRFIAHAGRPLYESEDDYAGGICIDPQNSNVVYISTNAGSPFNLSDTTNVPLSASGKYEIYRGVTADGGLTFTWQPMTQNSAVDNLRPYVPKNRTDYTYALLWFAGTYSTYTSWSSSVKGIFTNEYNIPPAVSIIKPAASQIHLSSLSSKLLLQASATDDGYPGALSFQWSVVSGPSGAVFENIASASTAISFQQPGSYQLRFTANDGAMVGSAHLHVTVTASAEPANASLWWKLDETGGGSAGDSSAHNNSGTIDGGVTWLETGGVSGGGAEFDGNSGWLNAADGPNLEPGGAFTIAYWVRLDSYNAGGSGLVCKRDGFALNNSFATYVNGNSSDTAGYKRLTVDVDGNNDRFTSTSLLQLNSWYHVALVFDGSQPVSQRAQIWINGILDRTAQESSALVPDYPSSFKAGLTHTGATTFLDGRLDDIRFFQRPLNSAEIGTLARSLNLAPIPTTGSAPVAMSQNLLNLAGSVNDDGLPSAEIASRWVKLSGPGNVEFGNPADPSTTVIFDQPGAYVLRLICSDGVAETCSDLSLNVVPNPDFYAGWGQLSFPGESDPSVIGPLADPEGDGVENILEFALGMNPNGLDARPWGSGQPGLPKSSLLPIAGDLYLAMEVKRPIGLSGLLYGARVSGDMQEWEDGVQDGTATPLGDGTECVVFRDTVPTTSATRRFIRLKVSYAE